MRGEERRKKEKRILEIVILSFFTLLVVMIFCVQVGIREGRELEKERYSILAVENPDQDLVRMEKCRAENEAIRAWARGRKNITWMKVSL